MYQAISSTWGKSIKLTNKCTFSLAMTKAYMAKITQYYYLNFISNSIEIYLSKEFLIYNKTR